jgi:glucose-1-phosphate cytidylyltransferase
VDGIGPVAILCGGRGTRLQEHTHAIPKALVEIGGKPILWHVIRTLPPRGCVVSCFSTATSER